MALIEGRIPEVAFKAVVGLTFGISILSVVVRIAIRLQSQKRLQLDDYLLIFAFICLTAATVLLYIGTSVIYFIEEVTLNGIGATQAVGMAVFLQRLVYYQKINWAYLALSWTTIFFVKFAFLSFFRPLVDRLPSMHMYWRIVVGFTALVFAFAVCDAFIVCPQLGLEALQCSGPAKLNTALAIGATVISLDIVTDVLILIIPVLLLWRVQIKPHQKLGLGAFLCLSVVMVIVAITRASGLFYHGVFDNSWIFLWQQVESCAAVTMISLTAFRSVFVGRGWLKPHRKRQVTPWQASVSWVLRRQKRHASNDQDLADVTIPSATLTGMRTFIHGNQSGAFHSSDETLVSNKGSQNAKQPDIYHYRHQSTSI
ncbi:hypothetical protein MMC16_001721 [Acarospora aff. strigata]|nr:hypothetical protein [Acarospora aff. strigata]